MVAYTVELYAHTHFTCSLNSTVLFTIKSNSKLLVVYYIKLATVYMLANHEIVLFGNDSSNLCMQFNIFSAIHFVIKLKVNSRTEDEAVG